MRHKKRLFSGLEVQNASPASVASLLKKSLSLTKDRVSAAAERSSARSRRQKHDARFWESVALRESLFNPGNPVLEKLFSLDKLRELYQSVRTPDATNIFNRILKKMDVACAVSESDLARVPATGATVVVANHPFGILDGILLGALLLKVRPDLKILTNYLLTGIPELDEYCIPLDPFVAQSRANKSESKPDSKSDSPARIASSVNQRGLRGACDWLRQGGMLLIFPAGEVAHLQWAKGITDPAWSTTAYRLARTADAAVLPVFIDGRNSVPFQLVGFVHPGLRTARLPKEFLQKSGSKIEVRIGSKLAVSSLPLPARNIKEDADRLVVGTEDVARRKSMASSAAVDGTEYLRWKTLLLANRTSKSHESAAKMPQIPFLNGAKLPPNPFKSAPEPLENAVPREVLQQEITQLPPSAFLESNEEYEVYCAKAEEAPQILREIGRLRELSFRAEGEGTGKSVDLDRFDPYYRHLFLWNRPKRELVGAYRLAKTTEILQQSGPDGLYTNTLFRFKPEFFDHLGPALELGRSFVRPEYQRQFAPLLLLWKAIGRYVAQNPENPVLFGAVSISNSYAPASRELMYQFFRAQFCAHLLSALVQPRRPFRSGRLKHWDIRAFNRLILDSEELSGSISEFESDGKGIPVLLKQYLKVGGQVLAFNVDGQFSDVLDGLIVVDLRKTGRKSLQRYLGSDGAESFLRHHSADTAMQASLQ
jgi:putative hemolysin